MVSAELPWPTLPVCLNNKATQFPLREYINEPDYRRPRGVVLEEMMIEIALANRIYPMEKQLPLEFYDWRYPYSRSIKEHEEWLRSWGLGGIGKRTQDAGTEETV